MHKVAILALNGVIPMDLAIPSDMFSVAVSRTKEPLYEVRVCGVGHEVPSTLFRLVAPESLDWLCEADTIIVPGIEGVPPAVNPQVIDTLRQAASRGTRIASICTGAFVLAEAGILDGLRATTHWGKADMLAELFPQICVEPDVLFIDSGNILTSAGVASGVDLCLHLIRNDYGAAVAANVARFIVMPIERGGAQSQLIAHETPESQDNLGSILLWLMENLQQNINVEQMAEAANMSSRTFNRKFKEQTGTTPLQWLLAARVKRAQQLLESTNLPIEHVAAAAGFESSNAFRDRFKRIVGIAPVAWRNTYKSSNTNRKSSLL